MLSRSLSGDRLSFSPNAFEYGREYEVKVAVRRRDFEFAEGLGYYRFKTGVRPPVGGEVSIIPLNGVIGSTDFSFKISNWVSPTNNSSSGIMFRLFTK
jgi:hypothetical protein